jgi:hypothetical protein
MVTSKVRSSELCEWKRCRIWGAVGVMVMVAKTLMMPSAQLDERGYKYTEVNKVRSLT